MTVRLKELTKEQLDFFSDKGYVVVKGAFAREDALGAQQYLWGKLKEKFGIDQADRSTWTQPLVQLSEVYRSESFDACNTARFADAIEDIVGEGRTARRFVAGETEQLPGWGWWPVNFALGADQPWTVPTVGWHWDGIHFRHYVDAPDQGLLCLCMFSDIGPRGGGTLVIEGSHKPVAKYLATKPDGIEIGPAIGEFTSNHPYFAELVAKNGEPASPEERIERFMNTVHTDADGFELRVIETTAEAGDVILCHPFLFHAASPNHSGNVRFMCNRTSPLKERMKLDRADAAEESPLERSIRLALEG